MRVSMATGAGRRGRPNEDFVGAVPDAVVLLDGAGIPGTESICSHGVAWYTHRLGKGLLGGLSHGDWRDLAAILAAAIAEVAAEHRDTCDDLRLRINQTLPRQFAHTRLQHILHFIQARHRVKAALAAQQHDRLEEMATTKRVIDPIP